MLEADIDFSDDSILDIINHYTKEAGVRNLEREIGSICRKIARDIAEKETKRKKNYRVTAKNVHKYLGVQKFLPEQERTETRSWRLYRPLPGHSMAVRSFI